MAPCDAVWHPSQCRGAAVSVLMALVEGARPFLAAADDK